MNPGQVPRHHSTISSSSVCFFVFLNFPHQNKIQGSDFSDPTEEKSTNFTLRSLLSTFVSLFQYNVSIEKEQDSRFRNRSILLSQTQNSSSCFILSLFSSKIMSLFCFSGTKVEFIDIYLGGVGLFVSRTRNFVPIIRNFRVYFGKFLF